MDSSEELRKKMVRIRKDYIVLCDYLEFVARTNNMDHRIFFSNLFKFSIDFINTNGFAYKIEEYKPRRIPKGFSISKEVYDLIDISYKLYKDVYFKMFCRKLYVAEFIELLLYVYCFNKLKQSSIDEIGINWGISKL